MKPHTKRMEPTAHGSSNVGLIHTVKDAKTGCGRRNN